jgi:nitrogen fixation protein NifB
MLNTDRHPCFNVAVKGECGRVHLPVAPKCNILCNYCNRKYDCVNESRPGVTSAVLKPRQAVNYLAQVLAKEPRITVAGIAGPGDPFANADETLKTVRLIREQFPDLLLCLATNGLGLPPYLDELAELAVSHITLTVNAVDPEIGAKIYSWVRDGKKIHRGLAAAEVLLERQLKSIRGLKARGLTVKVNTIIIPGINEGHVAAVAKEMAALGVDILNLMPVYPNAETPFGELPEPTPEAMAALRREAAAHLPQMHHCTRCRADAVGLPSFQVWGPNGQGFKMVAERPAPPPGGGANRWFALAESLKDCRAVLVSALGETPGAILEECGLAPIETSGFIEAALTAIYSGASLASLKGRRGGLAKPCSGGKGGPGGGCM